VPLGWRRPEFVRDARPLTPTLSPLLAGRGRRCATFFLTLGIYSGTRPPSLPPRGRCLDRLDHVGRERRPRRSGLARLKSPGGTTVPIVPGVSSDHPSGTTTGAPRGPKKCGLETFRRRVGAPVRRDFTSSALSGAPSPLAPSRTHPGGGRRVGLTHHLPAKDRVPWTAPSRIALLPYGRASRTMLVAVSAARRTRVKPASWRIFVRRFSPAWAPMAMPGPCDRAAGVQIRVEAE
jgi:hypothetical protein